MWSWLRPVLWLALITIFTLKFMRRRIKLTLWSGQSSNNWLYILGMGPLSNRFQIKIYTTHKATAINKLMKRLNTTGKKYPIFINTFNKLLKTLLSSEPQFKPPTKIPMPKIKSETFTTKNSTPLSNLKIKQDKISEIPFSKIIVITIWNSNKKKSSAWSVLSSKTKTLSRTITFWNDPQLKPSLSRTKEKSKHKLKTSETQTLSTETLEKLKLPRNPSYGFSILKTHFCFSRTFLTCSTSTESIAMKFTIYSPFTKLCKRYRQWSSRTKTMQGK